jgi:hypothetical protein
MRSDNTIRPAAKPLLKIVAGQARLTTRVAARVERSNQRVALRNGFRTQVSKIRQPIMALSIWIAIASVCPGARGAPKIQFDSTVFDFNSAAEGETVNGRFTFKNAGDAPLEIGTPDSACGCTVATLKTNILEAGATSEIAFTLDLTNLRGPIEKLIVVPSNDPQNPRISLTIKGESRALYELDPPVVAFDDIAPRETAREVVRIKRLDGHQLSIAKAEPSKDFLQVKIVPETNSQGQATRLIVDATGTGDPGPFSDLLAVYMENAAKPAFFIPIAGTFLSHIKVEPGVLLWKIPNPKDWPGPNPDESTTRKIIVSATRADETFDLGDLTSTIEDLLVKVDELEKGKRFELTLKLSKPLETSVQGMLSFETTLPAQRTVEIPIMIGVLKP